MELKKLTLITHGDHIPELFKVFPQLEKTLLLFEGCSEVQVICIRDVTKIPAYLKVIGYYEDELGVEDLLRRLYYDSQKKDQTWILISSEKNIWHALSLLEAHELADKGMDIIPLSLSNSLKCSLNLSIK